MLCFFYKASRGSPERGQKMNAQEILIQKIKESSAACQRGEISQHEANRVIAIFAEALRSLKA